MKRTNLVLDAELLEEATRLSGQKTYSRAVEAALRDWVSWHKSRQILEFQGSGVWQGDLGAMREDRPRSRSTKSQTSRNDPR